MYRFIYLLTKIIRNRSAASRALFATLALLGMTAAADAQPAISIISPAAGSTISGTTPVTFQSQVGTAAVAKVERHTPCSHANVASKTCSTTIRVVCHYTDSEDKMGPRKGRFLVSGNPISHVY